MKKTLVYTLLMFYLIIPSMSAEKRSFNGKTVFSGNLEEQIKNNLRENIVKLNKYTCAHNSSNFLLLLLFTFSLKVSVCKYFTISIQNLNFIVF